MSGNVQYLYIGNENKPLSKLNGYESGSFTIGADIPGDPAYGCAKNFMSNYMCGTQLKSINMDGESGGKKAVYDCSDEVDICENNPSYAVMQNDGNLAVYKGNDPTNRGAAQWSTYTGGKMSATQGTNLINGGFKNVLKRGESANTGQFLVNKNRNGYMNIDSDGSINILKIELNQEKDAQGNVMGVGGDKPSFALYEINPKKPAKNLLQTGYVDIDGTLHNYPSSMTEYKNKYSKIPNKNVAVNGGHDISNLGAIGKDACEKNCNARSDCGLYQTNSDGDCLLKNGTAYTSGTVQEEQGTDAYLRMKGPLGHKYSYKNYQDKDSPGNDIKCTAPGEVATKQALQNLCDKDPLCAAFNWNEGAKTGCLKNDSAYSDQNTEAGFSTNNDYEYNVKLESGGTSAFLGSCSQEVVGINSGRWDAYERGSDMSRNTKCGLARITAKDKLELANSENRLNSMVQKIKARTDNLGKKETKLNKYYVDYYNKIEHELKRFKKEYSKYAQNKQEISNINAWNDDSEIQLVSNNNRYMIFSIVAIAIVIALVKLNKKTA
jgi:hypothetical protein